MWRLRILFFQFGKITNEYARMSSFSIPHLLWMCFTETATCYIAVCPPFMNINEYLCSLGVLITVIRKPSSVYASSLRVWMNNLSSLLSDTGNFSQLRMQFCISVWQRRIISLQWGWFSETFGGFSVTSGKLKIVLSIIEPVDPVWG